MDRNPQAAQMADESMLRNLAAQAIAIWPQEKPLLARYDLADDARIADIGCGSGEFTARLAAVYPKATIVGIDILEGPLAYARAKHGSDRIRFLQGDAFALPFETASFDLVVCRHMTQSVPHPEKVLAELVRICKPKKWVHVLSEDYRMLHFPHTSLDPALDPDRLWRDGVGALSKATNTDERIGRITWRLLRSLGVTELHVDYAVVDTLRVARETFAEIIAAWRDGYASVIAERGALAPEEVRPLFDSIIASILDPNEYAVWQVPIISGQKA
jgi:SAM-dependent methyltransferase